MKNLPSTTEKEPLYIAAVGASAGGLNSLNEFFSAFNEQPQNICFVIAQHLSPVYESHLVELLSKGEHLTIKTASHKELLQPGIVYVTPPNKNIAISKAA